MRSVLTGLLGTLSLTGCVAGSVPVYVDNQACEGCPLDDERIRLFAQDIGRSATLTIEFLEREEQVGRIGWHLTLDYQGEVELDTTADQLQDMLDDRGYNVEVGNVQCVRWNVTYDNGRWLCEGNDHTPYDAQPIADTDLNWMGEEWDIDTWSDPSGDGCSLVACSP